MKLFFPVITFGFMMAVGTFLSNAAIADTSNYHCDSGQMGLPAKCTQLQGLHEYLNQNGPLPTWNYETAGTFRDCLKGVRVENAARKESYQSSCDAADDLAFNLMLKIGQDEIQKQQAWKAQQEAPSPAGFVDRRCFGNLCYEASAFSEPHPGGEGKASR